MPETKPTTVKAYSFEESALLRMLGFEFDHAEKDRTRVCLYFKDPDGQGFEALRSHRAKGLDVNSMAFCEAMSWAKRMVFATLDGR